MNDPGLKNAVIEALLAAPSGSLNLQEFLEQSP
ncbi:hypothetical protein GGE43_005281 [Agrobacterium tumefaciens]|uniref:SMC-Scp complex subunit ScpB n=1 Tax=Agrobacterium radiobacter TaxID=362 RepID=A0ABR6JEW2_AGRRD|nr:hypothetical protein [Agrobacterium radiobacter]MBB4321510.1 hypothetical protein [Agrobacterium radiobacter]MBB4325539.1 hypothetical protein [Agrobacterium radiobacter]MBB4338549.1 hypothetical protein [Agrobacterium radiobacter]MBB4458840.1 hypothetical protein [Agrobacterium radiobacter]